jgi:hypothetical protein
MFAMKNVWLIPLLAVAGIAQTPPQLEAVSTSLDTTSHMVSSTLVNHSAKKIVAYIIELRQFDGANQPVDTPLVVGMDNVYTLAYGPDSPVASLLASGTEIKKQFGPLSTDAVTASVSVLAVVYLDRTAEGDPNEIVLLFRNRSMHVQRAVDAAKLLATQPAATELRSRLNQISAIHERTAGGTRNQERRGQGSFRPG